MHNFGTTDHSIVKVYIYSESSFNKEFKSILCFFLVGTVKVLFLLKQKFSGEIMSTFQVNTTPS